jgi:hypothetical protein
LDLVVKQSQGISCDIFGKPQLQPEYAGMSMITMPHVQSNISISAKLGVLSCSSNISISDKLGIINSWFLKFEALKF